MAKNTNKTSLTTGVVQPPKTPRMATMVPTNSETAGATPRLPVRPPKPSKK
jgi:hypothetical protein